ncbi:MAG: ATP-binding protein [candidate division FCPU426 bacterium]
MAVHHFSIFTNASEIVAGEPFQLVIEARDEAGARVSDYEGNLHLISDRGLISPVLATNVFQGRWEGEVTVTGSGRIRIRAWNQAGSGEEYFQVIERGEPVSFPQDIQCPGCGQQNIAGKSEIFRCLRCNEIYFVDKYGKVIPLKHGYIQGLKHVKHLEFRIPSDVNYLNHVRNFIVGITSEENLDAETISQIEMALDESLANVVEHAYSYDPYQEIHVEAWLYPDRLEIALRDYGKSFDSAKTPLPDLKRHLAERKVGGLGRYLIAQFMDEVDYRSGDNINELRMVKRFSGAAS